jgi:D-3-phosphoglycerate dehydrogenase
VYDPFIKDEDIRQAGHTPATLDDLCRSCDVISLHAKVTPDNYHMFGKEQLAMMKPDAVLVNTARAELLDMDALYEALADKKIGGAALDVYEKEPLGKSSRYLPLENLTLTPHIGGASLATVKRAVQFALSDLKAYTEGKETRFCLNPEALK